MGQRLELHNVLVGVLGSDRVYFQPPSNLTVEYPCVVYNRDTTDVLRADNVGYKSEPRYSVIVIDRDPDTDVPTKIAELPKSRHVRSYVANGLNHYAFQLYY